MSRRVVVALRTMKEQHRVLRGLIAWLGYKQTAVRYVRAGRFAGQTHYDLRRTVHLAIDALLSFSNVPLRFITWLAIAAVVASPFISAAPIAAAQLVATAILAAYVGRIHDEVRRRPLYVVADEINTMKEGR